MTLRRKVATFGQFLFRFRSFLPLAIFVGLACLFWGTIHSDTNHSAYTWRIIAGSMTLAGVVLRCATIGRIPRGTSGRNTKRQKASFLNTTGIYSVVRNPLYLGNAMVWIGVTLLFENILLTISFGLILLAYYAFVVHAEEEYLAGQFGRQYALYKARTPAFFPWFGGWIPPDRPFSWRMIIRREHDSIFSAITGLVIVFHCMDFRVHSGHFMLRREWAIPWLALACLWVALKVLKKRTNLLHVPREVIAE